jgi:hypothetical protein
MYISSSNNSLRLDHIRFSSSRKCVSNPVIKQNGVYQVRTTQYFDSTQENQTRYACYWPVECNGYRYSSPNGSNDGHCQTTTVTGTVTANRLENGFYVEYILFDNYDREDPAWRPTAPGLETLAGYNIGSIFNSDCTCSAVPAS